MGGQKQIAGGSTAGARTSLPRQPEDLSIGDSRADLHPERLPVDVDDPRRPVIGFFQRDVRRGLDVLPAAARSPGCTSSGGLTAEEHLEEIAESLTAESFAEILRFKRLLPALPPCIPGPVKLICVSTAALVPVPVLAECVILLPFFRVAEDFIGLIGFLEPVLSGSIALVLVGVVLQGQFPVGFLDLRLRGGPGDSQDLIVVLVVHCHGEMRRWRTG